MRTAACPHGELSHRLRHSSSCTGEFRVDFEDESEGEAWIGIGQQWRRIGPAFEAEESVADDAPALPAQLPPQPQRQPQLPQPPQPLERPDAAEETCLSDERSKPNGIEQEQAIVAPPDSAAAGNWTDVVATEFSQLHRATVQSDGFGDEAPDATRARFAKLHAAVEAESSA
jgi:hypothetical protein